MYALVANTTSIPEGGRVGGRGGQSQFKRGRRSLDVQNMYSSEGGSYQRPTLPSLLSTTRALTGLKTKVSGLWSALMSTVGGLSPRNTLARFQTTETTDTNIRQLELNLELELQLERLERSVQPPPQQQQQQQPPAMALQPQVKAAADSLEQPQQPLLSAFLTKSDAVEISYARMLSDLCNMAYNVTSITEQELQQAHQLKLIATSTACPLSSRHELEIAATYMSMEEDEEDEEHPHVHAHSHSRHGKRHSSGSGSHAGSPTAVDSPTAHPLSFVMVGFREGLGA